MSSSTSSTLKVEVPRAFLPLLPPARYKGAYGGRGGAKSHFFAEQLLIRAIRQQTRAVCIREVQTSIKDSVRQLLLDKISALNLGYYFQTLDTEIRAIAGPGSGGLTVFKGMQSYNAENIKSLEGYHIAWVEEAQTLSDRSLSMLRPTLREDDSELWFSWNPRFKTDPVDAFFRQNPPPDAVSVNVNWRDNPWFPDVLRREMAHDFATDEDTALHVWEGAYYAGQGTILAKWVNRAEKEGRLNACEYEPDGAPVFVSSDIGFRDTASWWYWQPKVGGFSIIDYDQDTGLDADDWIPRIRERLSGNGIKPAKLDKIWLPHDARNKTFRTKHTTVEAFIRAFGATHIGIVPVSRIPDRINAGRHVIERCEFNAAKCEPGIDGLRAWQYKYNDETGVYSRDPLHNWASHPSDGFTYGCQVAQEMTETVIPETPGKRKPTIAELIKRSERPQTRARI